MKNMKNVKILCAVMAMVLLTTCVIGTTLARYTTNDSANDTARVAKWGIELAIGGTLFGSDYAEHNTENGDQIVKAGTSHSVSAVDGANIVAPGTKNDVGFRFDLTGTPEVAYEVIVEDYSNESIYLAGGYTYGLMLEEYGVNEATDLSDLFVKEASGSTYVAATTYTAGTKYYRLHDALDFTNSNSYYPLVWTVKGDGRLNSLNLTSNDLLVVAETAAAAVDALAGNANEDSTSGFTLTWAWKFDEQDDAADTVLGNLMTDAEVVARTNGGSKFYVVDVDNNVAKANGEIVANLDVSFNFEVTVQQVD